MKFTKDNIALVDGEIYVIAAGTEQGDYFVWYGKEGLEVHFFLEDIGYGVKTNTNLNDKDGSSLCVSRGNICGKVVLTTNTSIPGVPHIDRKHFQKHDVDVFELFESWLIKSKKSCSFMDFKAGHNANKKEFTREEMEQAMRYAITITFSSESAKHANGMVDKYINDLRPLSIPSLITCDDDFENIKVTW